MSEPNVQHGDLEALFHQANQAAPDLTDSNFTKVVLNQLPSKVRRVTQPQWVPDAVGIFVALFAIWMLADPTEYLGRVLDVITANSLLSLPTLILVSSGLLVTSFLGWLFVERS